MGASRLRAVARRGVRGVFYVIFAGLGLMRSAVQPGYSTESEVQGILVIRVDLMGDLLFSLPAVQALRKRYPEAHITLLALPYTAALAAMNPCINEIVQVDTNRIRSVRGLLDPRTWREYWEALRLVRARRFDLAISVYGRMGSLCAWLSGARRTVGYSGEAYPLLLNDPVPGGRHRERIHETEYAGRLARHAGARWEPDLPNLRLRAESITAARDLLAGRGVSALDPIVAIHAGSVNGSAKRWPASSWARFADDLASRARIRSVLIGSESDRPIADEVLRRSASDTVSLVGQTDVPTLAAVLARAKLVASGDSGPLHLATALGRPLLAVYGPTDPAIYGPYRPAVPTIVNRADIPCSPCYNLAAPADCPLADPICMRLVTVERMVEDALRLLADA
jgi:lipopolysaccharide heptosyltransferase II